MTWASCAADDGPIVIDNVPIEIIPEDCAEKYLGRKLAFYECQEVELINLNPTSVF